MWIFQAPYNWIKSFKTPLWLKTILGELQGIIVAMLLNIGKEWLSQLEAKIIEAQELGMSSEAKYEFVFKWAKANIPNIKDATANLLIEVVLAMLKKRNFSSLV
jgi:hypothetical protein